MRQDRAHEWGSWSKPSSDIAQPRNREARERHSEHATGQRRFEMGSQYDNAGLRRARRVAGRYISLRRANAQLADWIAASERRLSTIYILRMAPRPFLWPETAARSLPRGSCTCHAPGGGWHASRTSTGVGCASRPRRSGSWFTAKHYRKETILGNRLRGIEGRGSPKRYRLVSTGVITRLIP